MVGGPGNSSKSLRIMVRAVKAVRDLILPAPQLARSETMSL